MPAEIIQQVLSSGNYGTAFSGVNSLGEVGMQVGASFPITNPITSTLGVQFTTNGGLDCVNGISGVDCVADITTGIHISPEAYEMVVRQLGQFAQTFATLNDQVFIPIGAAVQQSLGKVIIETGTQALADGTSLREGLTGQDMLIYTALLALTLRVIWRITSRRNKVLDAEGEEESDTEESLGDIKTTLQELVDGQAEQGKTLIAIQKQLGEIAETTADIAGDVLSIEDDVSDIVQKSL